MASPDPSPPAGPAFAELERRVGDRTARVCVIGQGYVGLSVAAAAAASGMDVVGIDLDVDRVTALAAGDLVVPGVAEALFVDAMGSGRLRFGTGTEEAADADVVLVCVPTPLIDHRPDLSNVEAAGRALGDALSAGTLVVLESTTYPGTTEHVLRPLLEGNGLAAGRDFLLAYSPERIDPGNSKFAFEDIPRVVGGWDSRSSEVAAAFYAQLTDEVHVVSSCRAAELSKLLENTFRMVNIALVNELAQLCADQGIDTWEVIAAAATKPFGFMPFHPGPGVGGHCIPLDPAYLSWQSRRDTGRPFRLVELAKEINDAVPLYVGRRIGDALNEVGLPVRGARILALGVTYKPDVGDVRESAALLVLADLASRGAAVSYHDPFVERIASHGLDLERVELTAEAIAAADAVVLLTPHVDYDLDQVVSHARLLFDARNATGARGAPNVVVL